MELIAHFAQHVEVALRTNFVKYYTGDTNVAAEVDKAR